MESQVTSIVCPNCGANTSNTYNCEYCGSLLVRYVAADKDVDKSTFGHEVKIINGLANELKQNLAYQKIKKEEEIVVTTITDPNGGLWQVLDTPHCNFGTLTSNPFGEGKDVGISLRVTFETMDDDDAFAQDEKSRLQWFKQQDYAFLFTQQNHTRGVYYYIDFGQDVENATKLVSSIVSKEADTSGAFSFDTRMVTKKNFKNTGGILVDQTKKKAAIWGVACVVVYIIIRLLIY